jgi:hypothetical protein
VIKYRGNQHFKIGEPYESIEIGYLDAKEYTGNIYIHKGFSS